MFFFSFRHLCALWTGLLIVVVTCASWANPPICKPTPVNTAPPSDGVESNRADATSHTGASSSGVDAIVEQARRQDWSADQLFVRLGLDDAEHCLDYSDRSLLRQRHSRWSEAIAILDRVDPGAVDAWLVGLKRPPRLVEQETTRQLHCLLKGLVDAVNHAPYDVRLFTDITEYFDDQFPTPSALAAAADRDPRWLDKIVGTITRSTFRGFHAQAYIWHRKFRFTGRAFNRISSTAADQCGLHGEFLWRPDADYHRRCWHRTLTSEQREREILSATAGPGLSRHHWGTDVDILGLNPAHFQQGAILHDDWRWLDDHGLDYGFFQTYRDLDPDAYTHMEEPWHWSYYPIAQALWDFARHDPTRIETLLTEQWDRLERIWGVDDGPYFDHLRKHWDQYFFHIQVPSVETRFPACDGAPYTPVP